MTNTPIPTVVAYSVTTGIQDIGLKQFANILIDHITATHKHYTAILGGMDCVESVIILHRHEIQHYSKIVVSKYKDSEDIKMTFVRYVPTKATEYRLSDPDSITNLLAELT